MYINIILYFYSSTVMLVWSSRVIRERVRSHGGAVCFCPKFSTVYSLITPTRPYATLVPHLSRPTTTQCLFSPATAHNHVTLAFHLPQPTSTRCLPFTGHALHPFNAYFRNSFGDFTYGRMYLSTTFARFIAGQGDILLSVGDTNLKTSGQISWEGEISVIC